MAQEEQDQRLRQSQRAYVGFLDDGEQDGHYESLVKDMIANKGKRLVVNINDLRKTLPERARALIDNAGDEIVALQVIIILFDCYYIIIYSLKEVRALTQLLFILACPQRVRRVPGPHLRQGEQGVLRRVRGKLRLTSRDRSNADLASPQQPGLHRGHRHQSLPRQTKSDDFCPLLPGHSQEP